MAPPAQRIEYSVFAARPRSVPIQYRDQEKTATRHVVPDCRNP
jgi:hypothetical protein